MTDPATQAPRRLGPLALGLVFAAFTVLVALGVWQTKRLVWKEGLLATIEARLEADPLPLAEIIALRAAGDDIEYRPVELTGRFQHDREQFFFATLHGRSGYFVYTPMKTESGQTIFINRGFVDIDSKSPDARREGQIPGAVTVTGLARNRLDAKPSWVVPDNDPAGNIFYWKDLDAMAVNAGIDPKAGNLVDFFVDAGPASNPGSLPIGGVTRVDLPNNHLQYAITWYGLALALLGVTAVVWRRGRHRSGTPTGGADSRP